MLIEDVQIDLVAAGGGFKGGTNCLVRIRTDDGAVGSGQSGTWAYPEGVASVLEAFRTYLIGQDPLRIEHHWQHLYRMGPFRGNILHGAVSAVDIALWDIKGKHYEAPVWDLLGGRCRDKVRLHLLVLGDEHDPAFVSKFVGDGVAQGFTAIKFDPLPRSCGDVPLPQLVQIVRDVVAAAREAGGPETDLLLEFGRKLNPLQAPTVLDAIAEFHPLFVEDPTQIDSIQMLGLVASGTHVPIANGERLTSIWEFRELLERGGPQYVRPDLGMGGGITHCKKIAAVAESHSSALVSHNWLGPLLTAAAIHLDISIPNFVVQEYSIDDETAPENAVFRSTLQREGGYMRIPEAPGIGVDIVPERIADFPPVPLDWGATVDRHRRSDGSVHAAF
jgi:galactonate dehydratase